MTSRRSLAAILVVAAISILGASGEDEVKTPIADTLDARESEAPDAAPTRPEPRPQVAIETDTGRVIIELMPELAPDHVARFLELVREGFYEDARLHRVIPGFVIQGGDPNALDDDPENDGYGGLEDRRLLPEFSERPFKRGSVGMARDWRLDGASCQFFITLARSAHLDGQYTLFGRVIRGIDYADELSRAKADVRGRPEEPIRFSMFVMGDRRREESVGDEDP